MNSLHLVSKYAICYSVFVLLTYICKLNGSNRLLDKNGIVHRTSVLTGLQVSGILWLGIIPFLILNHSWKEILFGTYPPGFLQLIIIFTLLLAAFTFAEAEARKQLKQVVTYRNPAGIFNSKFITQYFISRIVFLICYEMFFRGYLLTDTIQLTGFVPAVIINVGLYTALHLFNDKSEAIACMPFGITLCLLCIWLGAAWPAILIHCVFTICYELKLVKKITNSSKKTIYESICYRLFGLYR